MFTLSIRIYTKVIVEQIWDEEIAVRVIEDGAEMTFSALDVPFLAVNPKCVEDMTGFFCFA